MAAVACSSQDDAVVGWGGDAGSDGTTTGTDADVSNDDASPSKDASADVSSPRDAALVDAAALPVVCGTGPCATALVVNQGESFCTLMNDKTVACWGDNANSQLARTGVIASGTAEKVSGLSNVVTLERGCAIDGDGATWCWGKGPYLGTGAMQTTSTPVSFRFRRPKPSA
jgi:hypothetical protein